MVRTSAAAIRKKGHRLGAFLSVWVGLSQGLVAAPATPAMGQHVGPERGDFSIALSIGELGAAYGRPAQLEDAATGSLVGNTSGLGLWWMASERLNVGLQADVLVVDLGSTVDVAVSGAPSLKYYGPKRGSDACDEKACGQRLVPFVLAEVPIHWDSVSEEISLFASLGFGAEFFMWPQFSVGGHLGASARLMQASRTEDVFVLDLGASAISVHYYW